MKLNLRTVISYASHKAFACLVVALGIVDHSIAQQITPPTSQQSEVVSINAFKKGNLNLVGGYGLVTWYDLNGMQLTWLAVNASAVSKHSQLGPAYAKLEYAVSDNVGLGLNAAAVYNEWTQSYEQFGGSGSADVYEMNITRLSFSAMAHVNFHFATSKTLDPYAGLGVGARYTDWTVTDNDPFDESNVVFPGYFPIASEITMGLRYYPLPYLAVYAEAGFAKSFFQGGLVLTVPSSSTGDSR
jgi:hypothetical protein